MERRRTPRSVLARPCERPEALIAGALLFATTLTAVAVPMPLA